MNTCKLKLIVLAFVAVVAVVSVLQAGSALKMNLEGMTSRAGHIFRGTVVEVSYGSMHLGGADLPTVTYTLQMVESFKGFRRSAKASSVEITFLGGERMSQPDENGLVKILPLPEIPQLQRGEDYLLLTTEPSRVGLSVPVGLGQGAFHIRESDGVEKAVNEVGNVGLFQGMQMRRSLRGNEKLSYQDLADEIRILVNRVR